MGALGSWAVEPVFEDQGMELLTIVMTLAGTPSHLPGHGDTQDHWLPPMFITPLALAVSYGNSNPL